jgi:hypothetical protein
MGSKASVIDGYLNIKNPMPWKEAQTLTPEEIKSSGFDGAVQMANGKVVRAIITQPEQLSASNAITAPPMNAADAQAMKQGTYAVLKGKFGEQGSAAVEAQKALARGLKEEIASQFPEIDNLNKAESKLLDLQPILERAVNRTANHQLIGIGTPVAGAAAKAVTGSSGIGAAAGILKAVLDDPWIKSRLAIAVSKGSKVPISQAAARVQAYSSALAASAAGSASHDAQGYSFDGSPNQPTTVQP